MSDVPPARRRKFKTCVRFNVAGHAHALTFQCFQGRPFLTSERSCQWLAESIDRARDLLAWDLWAYVFMPNHVHLLVCPRHADYDVSALLSAIKTPVSRRVLAYVRRECASFLPRMKDAQPNGRISYRFWQPGGGFDRNLWSEKLIATEIDYLHANPVRKGLCHTPEEWYWSSAADYAGLREGRLKIDFHSLPTLRQ